MALQAIGLFKKDTKKSSTGRTISKKDLRHYVKVNKGVMTYQFTFSTGFFNKHLTNNGVIVFIDNDTNKSFIGITSEEKARFIKPRTGSVKKSNTFVFGELSDMLGKPAKDADYKLVEVAVPAEVASFEISALFEIVPVSQVSETTETTDDSGVSAMNDELDEQGEIEDEDAVLDPSSLVEEEENY